MSTNYHYHEHMEERERLKTELHALEVKAGVRERQFAFVQYHWDHNLRRLYFSVLDKSLRKQLIAQSRRLRLHERGTSKAQLADRKDELAVIEAPGFRPPWIMPSLIGCAAVGIGYSLWSIPGALAGAVAGFFSGSAYVSRKRSSWRRHVAYAKAQVREAEAEVKKRDNEYWSMPFSETEEYSGGEDEGPQPEPEIHWHARTGNIAGIDFEIAKGVSVELPNDDEFWGSRPLHRAAANGSVEAIKFLISAGADVRSKNKFGSLPIHRAARRGCAEAIRVLLDAGSPVDARDDYGQQPIHEAAQSGDLESVEVLLDAGAKIDAMGGGGAHPNQPIHDAARAGHYTIVEALLARGADPNAVNSVGHPWDLAWEKYSDHQKTRRVLEAAGGGSARNSV